MTATDLPDLLDRLAERSTVAPAPVSDMLLAARRTRRRRGAALVAGGVAAVVAISVGAAQLGSAPSSTPQQPSSTASTGPAPQQTTGLRLVGLGHVGIEVPDSWATDKVRCGTPLADTVILDTGASQLCLLITRKVFDSVRIATDVDPKADPFVERRYLIDGVRAEGGLVTCSLVGVSGGSSGCTGYVFLPSENTYVSARSDSLDAVREILGRIRILPVDRVGVPVYLDLVNRSMGKAVGWYRERLEGLGLTVNVVRVTRQPAQISMAWPRGMIMSVDPRPGSVVPVGSAVTVTVFDPPR